ncbi:MAG: serine/threonine-protein kinase [Verrucomicrobiota bacterium]
MNAQTDGVAGSSGQIEEILFEGLTSLEDPTERKDFLDQTCHGNPALRGRLEKLVALHDEAEKFFVVVPEPGVPTSGLGDDSVTGPDGDFTEGLGTRIGRYRLLERLGEGGHGVVYQAEQLEPVRRRVALKIIRVGMSTQGIIARFEMERQALALMDHPNIARVLDAGATADGRPFFVMQMVTGRRITDFCDENQLDLPARLRLFISVCMAIQHAHQKGIIHCDIKPSNVLVSLHDGVAVPKVIDFGIAKATEGGHPDFSPAGPVPFIGTPAYMSPEQVDGDGLDVDTRSDIYSLGVLLYELLAGLPPRDSGSFKQAGPEEIRRLLAAPVLPPSDRLRSCPPDKLIGLARSRQLEPGRFTRVLGGDLDGVVMKAMEHDRQQRYATANGLAADLSRYLDHEPVSARDAGRRYRLYKLVRRNKIAFAAGAIVALALAGGFGTSTWLLIREHRALEEQARLRNIAEVARANEVKLREKAQAGETVAHAAVLISHGNIAQANELLGTIELENVPASLESTRSFSAVSDWLLHDGRWEEASQRLVAMAQAISQVDKSDSDSISIQFVAAAAAVADTGDEDLYEHLREMAADRFLSTTDPFVADEVVKSCLIMPADAALLEKLDPLLNVLKNNLPWERNDADWELMEGWQTLSVALAEYRRGDFSLADKWARRCLRHANRNAAREATALTILAMAIHHTGRGQEARDVQEAARTAVTAHFEKPFEIGTSGDGFWFDWVIARTLLKEADRVLGH